MATPANAAVPLTGDEIQSLLSAHGNQQAVENGDDAKNLACYQAKWGKQTASGNPVVSTEQGGNAGGEYIETNYDYAYVDTMTANVVPPNPAVTINAHADGDDDKAKRLEALTAECFRKNKMHSLLWRGTSLASVLRRSFYKLAWDASEKRVRVRVLPKSHVYFDEGAEVWEDVGYVIEAVPIQRRDFEARVKAGTYKIDPTKVQWSGYPSWLKDGAANSGGGDLLNPARDVFKWTVVYEVHDLRAGAFFHVLRGVKEPLFEGPLPYRWLKNPYALLTFTDDLETLGGISDSQLIAVLRNQLNECDTLDLNHFKTGFQVLFIDASKVNNAEEIRKAYLEAGEPGAVGVADVKPGMRLQDALVFSPISSTPLNTARLQARLEDKIAFTLAMSGYQRGNVGESDVATAYALTNEALRTRNGMRQKKVYDVISWAARGAVALYEQFMPGDMRLPLKMADRPERVVATRQDLGFVQFDPKTGAPTTEPLGYDYDVVPYSAIEQNKIVQTAQMERFWPALMWGVQSGAVDPQALMGRVLELLNLQSVAAKGGGGQQGGMPGAPNNVLPLPPLNPGRESGGTAGIGPALRAAPVGLPVGGPGNGGSGTE